VVLSCGRVRPPPPPVLFPYTTLFRSALADFIGIRLDGTHAAGADPAQVLFVAGSQDVSDVVIAGEHVVSGGEHRLGAVGAMLARSEEHTSELQSRFDLVCRLLLEQKK